MNNFSLSGTIQSCELRYTISGKAVAHFRVKEISTIAWIDKGAKKELKIRNKTNFYEIEAWEAQALLAQSLAKNSMINVDGYFGISEWQNEENQQQSKLVLKANKINVISSKSSDIKQNTSNLEPTSNQNSTEFKEVPGSISAKNETLDESDFINIEY